MANERLRTALLQRGVTPTDLANAAGVDPKTVERWISGRIPYRRHRYLVATHLGADETYLWPDALAPAQAADASESEILTVYPHRWAVPRDAWGHLFDSAEHEIGILVYAGLFLADDTGMRELLASKAGGGRGVHRATPAPHRVLVVLGDLRSHLGDLDLLEGINHSQVRAGGQVHTTPAHPPREPVLLLVRDTHPGQVRPRRALLLTPRPLRRPAILTPGCRPARLVVHARRHRGVPTVTRQQVLQRRHLRRQPVIPDAQPLIRRNQLGVRHHQPLMRGHQPLVGRRQLHDPGLLDPNQSN
ncbi:MAG: helix-turn-helix transcriptional regulator [Actinobacteria bacterium]|nr:helix-turn-helix transcriptional regulator [Actinomycetota bacterium]MBI3687950.1 helix-turn-helix transcriptional regulator [Actinomycetota bacterium]